jgi:hypothetical protein
VPLQRARYEFMHQLAKHSQIRRTLFGWPLRRWKALSDAARHVCMFHGWSVMRCVDQYQDLLPEVLANNPELQEQRRVHLEIIPLRDCLHAIAEKFGLMYNSEPAIWAMEFLLENLHQRARRPTVEKPARWHAPILFSQVYPAKTEEGFVDLQGLPEEEFFWIEIRIAPRKPNETPGAFRTRFNKVCRRVRDEYLASLAAEEWRTRLLLESLAWIDRLAQWQAGYSQSEIDPSIRTQSDRTKFSRGIKSAAQYIGISPRQSPHSSRHTGRW